VELLDMATEWEATPDSQDVFVGRDRESGELRWKASRVDLIFRHNAELRGHRRNLRLRGCRRDLRAGLREGLGQGDEAGPFRSEV